MQKSLSVADRKRGGVLETVKTLVYAIIIALAVRTVAYEPFNIPSGSMKPTLLVGDYLFVSKFSYGYSHFSLPLSLPLFQGRLFGRVPERGDVAVFKLPSDGKTDYIKRIVGLPGDKIQVLNGVLNINGKPVELQAAGTFDESIDGRTITAQRLIETLPNGRQHYILDITPNGPLDNTGVFEVPPGHVFAMGDNRDNSLDSRTNEVGYVPIENLIGRADILFFSVDGTADLFMPWTWPTAIRYDRLFSIIR
ncbi:signal peptidase I [Arboricoccus pini]|uniref:Signal peptidase I n=1 Tax=Arboricoccus pini TaxID=1963835 RepID=A0A212QPE0_9PROT|nr:signal peptidase I [Arboricoccus pini]SNB61316.1 signal peptidase I [Arboricoccus pini]